MPDYQKMYQVLFQQTTQAIAILQKAQQQTEELYISDGFPDRFRVDLPIMTVDCQKERPETPQE